MRRGVVVVATLILVILALSPVPASAASVWDPDDVEGPLDVRWLGTVFESATELQIVVSFYDGFRVAALPTHVRVHKGVFVGLQSASVGFFLRRTDGRVIFIWGDFGSSCGMEQRECDHVPVTRVSPDVLRVTIDPTHTDPWPFTIHVETTWHAPNGRLAKDRTGEIALGCAPGVPSGPPCVR